MIHPARHSQLAGRLYFTGYLHPAGHIYSVPQLRSQEIPVSQQGTLLNLVYPRQLPETFNLHQHSEANIYSKEMQRLFPWTGLTGVCECRSHGCLCSCVSNLSRYIYSVYFLLSTIQPNQKEKESSASELPPFSRPIHHKGRLDFWECDCHIFSSVTPCFSQYSCLESTLRTMGFIIYTQTFVDWLQIQNFLSLVIYCLFDSSANHFRDTFLSRDYSTLLEAKRRCF